MIRTDKPIFYASISDRLPKPFCRINVMQTPAGYTLDYHIHEFYHVNHITGGSVYVMIAGHETRVEAGQTFILPACTAHRLTSENGYSQIGMDISPSDDDRCLFRTLECLTQQKFTVTSNHVTEAGYERLRAFIDAPSLQNRMRAVNLAEAILLDSFESLRSRDPKCGDFVKRFTNMLSETPPWQLSLDDMCRQLGVSRACLERASKQLFGCGAVEYCARLRFKEICTLLKTTDLTLEAIAAKTGFCNAGHLSVFFTKRAGFTPGQYRISTSINTNFE